MEWYTRMSQSVQTLSSASSNVLSWLANQWQQPIHPNAADWKDQHIRILSTEDLEFQQCTHHKLHAQKPVFPNGPLACLTPFDQNAGWEVQTLWRLPPTPRNWHTLVESLPCTQLDKAVTSPVPSQLEILYYVFLSLSCMYMWCVWVCVCCTQLVKKVTSPVPSQSESEIFYYVFLSPSMYVWSVCVYTCSWVWCIRARGGLMLTSGVFFNLSSSYILQWDRVAQLNLKLVIWLVYLISWLWDSLSLPPTCCGHHKKVIRLSGLHVEQF